MHAATIAALLLSSAASLVAAQSIQFPAACTSDCTPFGNALLSKCMVTPTSSDTMKASTAIATCFCQTYATNGVPCLQCIGNAPSLLGLNSTTLFMSLGSACAAGDSTYAAAAALIDPVVHDAVIANVVSATTSAGAASSAGAKPTTTGAAAVVPSAVRSTTSNAASKQAVTVLSAVAGVLVALF